MLLGTLGASLLGNFLTGKGTIATSQGQGTVRAGEGTVGQVRIFNVTLSFNKF